MARSAHWRLLLLLPAVVALSGCELVEGIFKAGMAVGIFVIIFVAAIVFFLVGKIRRNV
jgi:uncharacterized membrane protein